MATSVRRVVAGVSGSRRCLPALRYAAGLAEGHQAVLYPVLIWSPPGGELAERRSPSVHLRTEWERVARQRLREALTAAFGGEPAGVTTRPLVVRGEPGWVLVHAADKASDVLVVGTGRQGHFTRLAGGKVSRYCLAHAVCPVIAVPPSSLELHAGSSVNTWMFRHRGLKELTAAAAGSSPGKPGAQ